MTKEEVNIIEKILNYYKEYHLSELERPNDDTFEMEFNKLTVSEIYGILWTTQHLLNDILDVVKGK